MNNTNFLEQLIIKAVPNIDDAWLEMMVWDAKPVLEERVFTKIIVALDENKRAELNQITDKNKWIDGKVYEFLSNNIDNYEDFIANVYNEFEEMYLKEHQFFSK